MNTHTPKTVSRCGLGEHGNSDESLVSAARGGDLAAFTDLCRRNSPRVFRTLCQITRNHEDAEDALQDSLMRAFVHLESFDGRAQFSTWLTRIAVNSALMILRKKRKYIEIPIDPNVEDDERSVAWELADTADDPECRFVRGETNAWVKKAIGDLNQKLRGPIELWGIQELSTVEGARQLNISTAAYKSRMVRAKAILRTKLGSQTGYSM